MNLHELVGKKTYIYGTGKFASRIKEVLEKENIKVLAFLELNKEISTFEQLPVINSSHFEKLDKIFPVIVGLGNPQADIQVVTSSLGESCFRIINPIQFAVSAYESGHKFENYWLTGDMSIYSKNEKEIEFARSLLSDEKSKVIFDDILKYRKTGEINYQPERLEVSLQYIAPDLPWKNFFSHGLNVLDGGAFDGDTYENFKKAGIRINSWTFVEPDLNNFEVLLSRYSNLNDQFQFINLALSLEVSELNFDSTSDVNNGSKLSTTGSQKISVTNIDAISFRHVPNFIKLDIEGEELRALQGGRQTITKNKPVLAISIYHLPSDHWKIITYINLIMPGGKFFIRVHGAQTFDSVLYYFPRIE
jgi:FkbM family methyltransferase